MNCKDALVGLQGALDGEALAEAVEQEIADHLDSCSSCGRAAREISSVHRLLLEEKFEAMSVRKAVRSRAIARPRPPSMGIPALVAAGFLAAVVLLLARTSTEDPRPVKTVRRVPPLPPAFRKAEIDRARAEEARREAEDRLDELRRREGKAREERRKETDDAFAEIVRQRKAEEARLAALRSEEEAARRAAEKALALPAPRPMTQVATPRVARVEGKAYFSGRRECLEGDEVRGGESIETVGTRSGIVLMFPDSARVEAGAETELRDLQDGRFEIRRGSVWAQVAKRLQPLRIVTPHGEARILGTILRLKVDGGTRLEVEEGKVELRNGTGKRIDVAGGHYGIAAAGVDFASHPLPPLLFGDSFDSSRLNEWPTGWLKHEDGLSRSGFAVLGNGDRYIGALKPAARTTQHAIFPAVSWPSAFTLSFRLRLTGFRSDRAGVELADDRQDPSLEYDATAGVVRVDWPRGKPYRQVPYRIAPGAWTDWTVNVDGPRLRVAIDRKPVLDLEVAGFGRVHEASLVSRGADSAQFDDVKVLRR